MGSVSKSSVPNVSKVSSVSSIKDGATSISGSIFRYLVFLIILVYDGIVLCN